MKRAVWLLVTLVMLAVPSFAQAPPRVPLTTIFAIAGEQTGSTGAHGLSVGWSLNRTYENVAISARMNNGGGPAAGVAYLMRAIGPEASTADEVARKEFDLPLEFDGMLTLFTGLELAAGKYWLVFSRPLDGTFSYANWVIAMPAGLTTARGAKYIGTTWPQNLYAADWYMPRSYFNPTSDWFGYQFEVTGDRAAVWPQDPDYPEERRRFVRYEKP